MLEHSLICTLVFFRTLLSRKTRVQNCQKKQAIQDGASDVYFFGAMALRIPPHLVTGTQIPLAYDGTSPARGYMSVELECVTC